MNWNDHGQPMDMLVQFPPLPFQAPGRYEFRVLMSGMYVGRAILEVQPLPVSSKGGSRVMVSAEIQLGQEIAPETLSFLRDRGSVVVGEPRRIVLQESLQQPAEIELASLRDGRLRLLRPLRMKIARHGEIVTTQLEDISEYGHGATLVEAIEDLQRCVAELFFTLEEDQAALGSDLRRVREWLAQYIARP